VARGTVERLMRRLGLQGVRRGKGVSTTVPNAKATCPLDRVNWQFPGEEAQWQGLRVVVAHNPQQAAEQTSQRRTRIAKLQQRAEQLTAKLGAQQEEGKVHRSRKLSDSGAKARFFHEVSDAHLPRIVRVDLMSRQGLSFSTTCSILGTRAGPT